jgi:hypothetical protein
MLRLFFKLKGSGHKSYENIDSVKSFTQLSGMNPELTQLFSKKLGGVLPQVLFHCLYRNTLGKGLNLSGQSLDLRASNKNASGAHSSKSKCNLT